MPDDKASGFMKNDEDLILQFKKELSKEAGATVSNEESKAGLETLAKFFDLLWEFDRKDKEKAMEMKGLKNESANL